MLARVIQDSRAPSNGARLTTMEVMLPRVVLAEFNTHRAFSRNSASSRAIPCKRFRRMVRENPYVPYIGTYAKGMGDDGPLMGWRGWAAHTAVQVGLLPALALHRGLEWCGVSKQVANRYLEPWMWTKVLVTGSNQAYLHFFGLRCGIEADPAIRETACVMRMAYWSSTPVEQAVHAPYSTDVKTSVEACARVSYLSRRVGLAGPLYDRLIEHGHWSPFEHYCYDNPRGAHANHGTPWESLRSRLAGARNPERASERQ